ncbi:MAG TPA: phosphate signaling complex protein PhoU [Bryobacteraceae bacterium]|nr:phosphate signaling complex protein PhoU [Bryobacteraceae bacterium]
MRPFEQDFASLNTALLHMGEMVARSVHRGVLALVERNAEFAYDVMRDETEIDESDLRISNATATLIAREQPVASDMRLVVTAIKISTDLERMGDLAVNVASRALSLMSQPELKNPIVLTELAGLVQGMVLRSLDAFVRRDATLANEVLAQDNGVDEMRAAIQRQVIEMMRTGPDSIERALDHLIAARSLERIGDHARNIAEGVIYLVQGIDVRHRSAA